MRVLVQVHRCDPEERDYQAELDDMEDKIEELEQEMEELG